MAQFNEYRTWESFKPDTPSILDAIHSYVEQNERLVHVITETHRSHEIPQAGHPGKLAK